MGILPSSIPLLIRENLHSQNRQFPFPVSVARSSVLGRTQKNNGSDVSCMHSERIEKPLFYYEKQDF